MATAPPPPATARPLPPGMVPFQPSAAGGPVVMSLPPGVRPIAGPPPPGMVLGAAGGVAPIATGPPAGMVVGQPPFAIPPQGARPAAAAFAGASPPFMQQQQQQPPFVGGGSAPGSPVKAVAPPPLVQQQHQQQYSGIAAQTANLSLASPVAAAPAPVATAAAPPKRRVYPSAGPVLTATGSPQQQQQQQPSIAAYGSPVGPLSTQQQPQQQPQQQQWNGQPPQQPQLFQPTRPLQQQQPPQQHYQQQAPPPPQQQYQQVPQQQQQPLYQQQFQQPSPQPQFQQQQQAPQQQYQQQAPQQYQQQGPYAPTQSAFVPPQQLPQQQKPRPKIDPDMVPSAIGVQLMDQKIFATDDYRTNSKIMPPLASTNFVAVDEGNSNPRFIRSTLYNIPESEELSKIVKIPIGVIIQPLAELNAGEAPVPLVDFGDKGPVRCQRCKAYMNPFMLFSDGGRKFSCNMCQMVSTVPEDYFCNLDMQGRRVDLNLRPELRLGTVDFAVPSQEYSTRPPVPAHYIYMIDVSYVSVSSGVTALAAKGILNALANLPLGEEINGQLPEKSPVRVAIMTYDRHVHFYNLSAKLTGPQMYVVSEVEDVFVPLSEGLFVDVEESADQLKSLLTQIPEMFKSTQINESCFGAAATAAKLALTGRGGRVFAFQTILPNVGPGTLKQRDDIKLLGNENERQLYVPQDQFYKKLAIECTSQGVSFELFLPTRSYVDLATIGLLASTTGGGTHYYKNFAAAREGPALQSEIVRTTGLQFGFDGLMRIRTSTGIKIVDHYGHFYMQNETDLELGGIDSDKAIGVLLAHENKLSEQQPVSIQCALLYTTATGKRRIRVHNLCLPVTPLIANVFKMAELDATLNLMVKRLSSLAVSKSLAAIRDELTEVCIKILAAYRKHCVAVSSSSGQLILPESMKLMPIYALSIMKHAAFRATDVSFDERVDALRMWKGVNVPASVIQIYPKMYAIDTITTQPLEDNPELYPAPEIVRLSIDRCENEGIYLVETGHSLILWIGTNVNQQVLKGLFNTQYLESIDVTMTSLPQLENPLSKRVNALIKDIRAQATGGRVPSLFLARKGEASEIKHLNAMIEDKNNGLMSYVDYLAYMHKQIMNEIGV